MPVQIGQKPDHGFETPMGLLTDCHRRIEKFLGAMGAVAREYRGGALDERGREALEKSVRYFENAAPHHNEDEEESLFPRLRESDDPEVRRLLAEVDQLEGDHRANEARHAEANEIARQWVAEGTLPPERFERLLGLVEEMEGVYRRHIALEDERVFPLAQRVLSDNQVKAMGREMAQRRGLDAAMPPRRCRHGRGGRHKGE
jgi:hemerythrin-like domain-containing protein